MRLTNEEIDRQARDTSHLNPNPVRCVRDGFVCDACGARRGLEIAGLFDWIVKHGKCKSTPTAA